MNSWMQTIFIIGAVLMVIYGVFLIKSGRIHFSKESLSSSAFTFGVLAVFLLVVIWICMRVLGISV